MDYQQRREALNHLFHQPEWEGVVSVEIEVREKAILDMIALAPNDPHRAANTAYFKGKVDAIAEVWRARGLAMKNDPSKDLKGEANAHVKTKKRQRHDRETETSEE